MLKSIKGLVIATVLIVLALVVPAWAKEEKPTSDKNELNLVGTYHIVSAERDGQPVPSDHFRGDTVQITRDKITTLDKDRKEILVVSYKIDPSTKPYKITTVTELPIKDMKTSGLVEKDGDMVRLICAMPGGKDPTTFKTGNQQQMFVLKSQSK
jgi:uncharacterized protein (TIGR03067 family)